ncbi:unnamed protein product [Pedinophyceae sp. YPF-701]|nr:unnamed protein product [Pedinophyceae sp. YPF-701]
MRGRLLLPAARTAPAAPRHATPALRPGGRPVRRSEQRAREGAPRCRMCRSTIARASQIDEESEDANQLLTLLNLAIKNEDYAQASQLRDRIQEVLGVSDIRDASWHKPGVPEWLADRAEQLDFRITTPIQRRALETLLSGKDAIVKSITGSGKTLACLIPALSRLDYTVPLDDVLSPQLVVVTPTRELGVQIVLLIFKLFGGNISSRMPGDKGNMFNYQGPRGLKVRGVLSAEEAYFASDMRYLKGAHVIVGTPQWLAAAVEAEDRSVVLDAVRVLWVDEADECQQNFEGPLAKVYATVAKPRPLKDGTQLPKAQVILSGATIADEDVEAAQAAGALTGKPAFVSAGRHALPPGIAHRYCVVPSQEARLLAVARMMKAEVEKGDADSPPPRVLVFANSDVEVKAAAQPLRGALWGVHKMSVLLPSGEEPILAMESFRDNRSSLMLCSPAASRGIDFPSVSHVYTLGLPQDEDSYVHATGRSGRVGSTVRGVATAIVEAGAEEAAYLRMMEGLGIEPERVEVPGAAFRTALHEGSGDEWIVEELGEDRTEEARQALEELMMLYATEEERLERARAFDRANDPDDDMLEGKSDLPGRFGDAGGGEGGAGGEGGVIDVEAEDVGGEGDGGAGEET